MQVKTPEEKTIKTKENKILKSLNSAPENKTNLTISIHKVPREGFLIEINSQGAKFKTNKSGKVIRVCLIGYEFQSKLTKSRNSRINEKYLTIDNEKIIKNNVDKNFDENDCDLKNESNHPVVTQSIINNQKDYDEENYENSGNISKKEITEKTNTCDNKISHEKRKIVNSIVKNKDNINYYSVLMANIRKWKVKYKDENDLYEKLYSAKNCNQVANNLRGGSNKPKTKNQDTQSDVGSSKGLSIQRKNKEERPYNRLLRCNLRINIGCKIKSMQLV